MSRSVRRRIHRGQNTNLVLQEPALPLRPRTPAARQKPADRALRDLAPELGELAVDARRTPITDWGSPCGIRALGFLSILKDVRRSPSARDRQVPEPTKSFAVPAHNGLTVPSARVQADHVEDSHIQNRRSMRPHRRGPVFRCSRASCCRSARFSSTSSHRGRIAARTAPFKAIRSETTPGMLHGRYLCVNLRDPVFASHNDLLPPTAAAFPARPTAHLVCSPVRTRRCGVPWESGLICTK